VECRGAFHGVLSEGFADANVVSHCLEHDLLLDAVVLGESPHNVRQCIGWYEFEDVVLRVNDVLGSTAIEAVLFHWVLSEVGYLQVEPALRPIMDDQSNRSKASL